MKLLEALDVLTKSRRQGLDPFRVQLLCGFTPLHIQTFLAAHLQQRSPDRLIEMESGLYGDLPGNLERAGQGSPAAIVVLAEWADFDSRLGFRTSGGWGPARAPDIFQSAQLVESRLRAALSRLLDLAPVVLSPPTLPLPPAFHTSGWQASELETQLDALVSSLVQWAASQSRVRILNRHRLDRLSPFGQRLDIKSELTAGFPYTLPHTDALATLLAALVLSPTPKKGLITDLDDTLWNGILGEIGVGGISWSGHSHIHGLYQQLLASLADSGVLIGVASKNDPKLVEEAFHRDDLLLPGRSAYPIQAGWGVKSESVRRIIETWNIGPDSVVFVDDNPMELAEVKAAFPQIDCVLFPKHDHRAIVDLLDDLRDWFGKATVTEEDRLRLESIRNAPAFREGALPTGAAYDTFLAQSGAIVTFDFQPDPADGRVLELVNKTNQFNLNGKRYSEAAWSALQSRPRAFLVVVSYKDKYGPLGKIAVLTGQRDSLCLQVDSWVMSCRAFSRRIEHQCLQRLFRRYQVNQILLSYQKTPRNGPLGEFLTTLAGEAPGDVPTQLSKEGFEARCPALHHTVEEFPQILSTTRVP